MVQDGKFKPEDQGRQEAMNFAVPQEAANFDAYIMGSRGKAAAEYAPYVPAAANEQPRVGLHSDLRLQGNPLRFKEMSDLSIAAPLSGADWLPKPGDMLLTPSADGQVLNRLSGMEEPRVNYGDRLKASEMLDEKLGTDSFQSEACQRALRDGFIGGDIDKFMKALLDAGNDVGKLRALVEEAHKTLKACGADTGISTNSDGKVVVHSRDKEKAVELDPQTGQSRVVRVDHDIDGAAFVRRGEYVGQNAAAVFKDLGDHAVNGVLGRPTFISIEPIFPSHRPLLSFDKVDW